MFEFHRLNAVGQRKAVNIANIFQAALESLELENGKDGREMAIVRTKLEEACFFAKKAMAVQPSNQEE